MTATMIDKIRDYLTTQPIRRAWLFGSFARNEETPDSDVDILVCYDRSQPIGLLKISGMHVELEDLLGRQVDLVDEETLLPWVKESVNRDRKLIYERAN